jgi:ribose/xylose/arabinose/galactoside ABC-type transport system permease subunit
MTGGRFSLIGSVLGALIIWMITFTLYIYNVPANALLVGKAVLVLVIIILASDHARRLLRIERNSKK